MDQKLLKARKIAIDPEIIEARIFNSVSSLNLISRVSKAHSTAPIPDNTQETENIGIISDKISTLKKFEF